VHVNVRSVGVGRVGCTCLNEEGGDGDGVGSEASSLLSYTRRYISLVTESSRSWRSQPEAGGCCDNQWTCVHV
jgi:hypothetical protein